MCNCGRKRQQAVTSAQTAQAQANQDQAEANELMRQVALQTVTEAERMLASAARAANNARS